MLAVAIVFWVCAALILYTQLGYGLLLALLVRVRGERRPAPAGALAPVDAELPVPASDDDAMPSVSLVVAA